MDHCMKYENWPEAAAHVSITHTHTHALLLFNFVFLITKLAASGVGGAGGGGGGNQLLIDLRAAAANNVNKKLRFSFESLLASGHIFLFLGVFSVYLPTSTR